LQDGTEFDSSLKEGRTPLEFTVGSGQMIKGFDAAVVGMKLNETKTVTLQPSDAYGEVKPELRQFVPKEQFGTMFDQVEAGKEIPTQYGNILALDKNSDGATLDFNHKLAGKTLTFWIQIVKITKAK
jgi:FKBP-type peptidyl-prolyl cis-trans isomerase 2